MGCKGEGEGKDEQKKDKRSCLLVDTFSLIHRILGCGNEFYSRDFIYFTGQDISKIFLANPPIVLLFIN